MKRLNFYLINVLQTLLRVLPFPCKTGMVKIGNPDRNAPVLLTCNFRLTVERVRRALEGIDAYLLVANSRGINVWCGAAGGHFTNHDVISALKTSGIEDLVDHRQVILPQLAATGIEGRIVGEKTGWRVIWGPVYATSIPQFLRDGMEKTLEMRVVSFPLKERVEMAVAWAFPISLLALILLPFWRAMVLPLVGFIWAWAFLIFLSFPLYERRLRNRGKSVGFVFFDFGERGIMLFLWALFMLGLAGFSVHVGSLSWALVLRWGLSSFIVVLIMGLDLMGSTPVYKSGLLKDRLFRIELDTERCKGAGFCEQVCPRNVFEVDRVRRLVFLPRAEQCVQCGACVVQCPIDALHFRGSKGEVITPDTIRRFKLNLLGTRNVDRQAKLIHHRDAV